MQTLTERATASLLEAGPIYAKTSGTFLKRDAVSLNNRFYPASTVERVVADAQARLDSGDTLTMLVKHGSADTDESREIVGRLTRVYMDGDYARYDAEIPNTEAGRDMSALLQGGFINTVSLRSEPGSADVEAGMVGERAIDIVHGFKLGGVDYTLYPGIKDHAKVSDIQIFESVDPSTVTTRLTEEASPAATYSASWYRTVDEAVQSGTLRRLPIDTVLREYGSFIEADSARDKLPDSDFAGPHRSFPIVTQQDVEDAARLIGHAANPAAVKRKIIAIATRKGFTLPDSWQHGKEESMSAKKEATTEVAPQPSTVTEGAENTPAPVSETAPTLSPVERVSAAMTQVADALAALPNDVTEADLKAATTGSAGALLERLLAPTPAPAQEKAEPFAALRSSLTEALNSTDRVHLSTAHNHIATTLGMECAPSNMVADRDHDGEALSAAQMSKMIAEAIREGLRSATPASVPVAVPATVPTVVAESSGMAQITAALKAIAEGQQALAQRMTVIETQVPEAAAKAAADVAWRPERKTQIVENNDAKVPGGGDTLEGVQARLRDASIPIELRMREAANLIAQNLPLLQLNALFNQQS